MICNHIKLGSIEVVVELLDEDPFEGEKFLFIGRMILTVLENGYYRLLKGPRHPTSDTEHHQVLCSCRPYAA